MTTAYDARAAALHRNLDKQIENLERKNYHNRELITDLKKQIPTIHKISIFDIENLILDA